MSFVRSVRCVCRIAPRVVSLLRPVARSTVRSSWQSTVRSIQTSRILFAESVAPPPTKPEIESRVIEVIKKFEKVDPAMVTAASTFKSLGLDSLDGVELVMAFEDEFNIEISDA